MGNVVDKQQLVKISQDDADDATEPEELDDDEAALAAKQYLRSRQIIISKVNRWFHVAFLQDRKNGTQYIRDGENDDNVATSLWLDVFVMMVLVWCSAMCVYLCILGRKKKKSDLCEMNSGVPCEECGGERKHSKEQ